MSLRRLGEFGLIARLQSRLKFRSPRTLAGIGDDCAVYRDDGRRGKVQIVTCDTLVEKVHFDLSTSAARQLGRKALAVNISDIAAMGGTPLLALVSIGVPRKTPVRFLDRFYDGLNEISEEYQIELAGGDTVASPSHFYISVTLLGEAAQRRWFCRSGARPGDKILVTGTLGDSALGLHILKSGRKSIAGPQAVKNRLIQKHLDPTPRMAESGMLAKSRARITSMIDISDGLAQDLAHICKASGVGAVLWEESLPTSQAFDKVTVLNDIPARNLVLAGGEDYELLFTLSPENVRNLICRFDKVGRLLACIGEITNDPETVFLMGKGGQRKVLSKVPGFDHFTP
ncbi:MAG: thiamine-phosphate kinase [Nitrospinales bacterium]